MKRLAYFLVSFGLFGAGAIWGKIIPGENFFKVANVHDLFDIFGAAATCMAVVVAAFGLRTWRYQTRASTDHDLATKFLVALRRYQDEMVRSWHYAESSVAQIDACTWIGSPGKTNFLVGLYEGRLKYTQAARAQVEAMAVECAEMWDDEIRDLLLVVYVTDDLIASFIETYVQLLIKGTLDEQSDHNSTVTLKRWIELSEAGVVDHQSAQTYIGEKFSPLRQRVRRKLINS
ncbi:hypothetical protein [Pseudomonas asiatica]|uniref:DUF4760 domain-containing protein n=1 Tax=Pseudomonas asiatica TaxID=2219225 RepID=A0A9X4D4Y4_9PSED|nr:hypothetical protein [Pseudomonas asiatica]MDD2109684.1 hypothetical protein [Pseudomonas asiatica]